MPSVCEPASQAGFLFVERAKVTDTTETTEEQKKEQRELEQKEAEQGFNAGFQRARGEEPPAEKKTDEPKLGDNAHDDEDLTAGKQAAETDAEKQAREAAEEKAKEDADAKAAEDRQWAGVPEVVREKLLALETHGRKSAEDGAKRLRNIEGHIGGLNSKLESALTTANAAAKDKGGEEAAPSKAQVQEALSDPEAWKRLKEDFPDWAGPVEKEFAALRSEIAKASKPATVDVSGLKKEVAGEVNSAIAKGLDTAEERAFVRLKYPDWRDTVKSPEFKAWFETQPDDVKALAASDSGNDAVKMLDAFKTNREQSEDARKRKQKRLEGNLTPMGSGAPPDTGISDDEAFSRGFKRARGK